MSRVTKMLTTKLGAIASFAALYLTCAVSAPAESAWQAALAQMPLAERVTELNKTNCIPLLLQSFQQNAAAKALIFMPGATDEFYFFNRGYATLTNGEHSVWDALVALTNQTLIRVDFRSPFVLVHSMEDPLEPLWRIEDQKTAHRILKAKFVKHAVYNDRDWDFLHPILTFELDTRILPGPNVHESNHFYRHSLAVWNLTGWEALEAISLAGKTTFAVQKRKIIFAGDTRYRDKPPVPNFP